ncbi:leukocyte elastase inhibitor-like [Apostichopus japonicus]|uniref:leukocyte elastase inhibitor-like n=1 Tax=Stichopus japonicus TaxID=307972 RepID=UPI003AB5E78F
MSTTSTSEASQLANSLNEFSWELYGNIGKDPSKNLFFSPYSIMAALTMTFAGASSNTAKQMSQVLRIDQFKGNDVHSAFQELNDLILSPNALFTLKSANRLYGQKDYTFLESFLKTTKVHYQAELMPIDFKRDAEIARTEINSWVSEQTNNKIKDLIAPGVLDSLTVLVLVNAVYFKGNWLSQFDPESTSLQPFHASSSESIPVDMMYQEGSFDYFEDKDLKCQVLSLPYVGNTLRMVIILPDLPNNLSNLESKINMQVITSWVKRSRKQKVGVSFPRFKLEESFDLNDHLTLMGMSDVFNVSKADLSGITESEDLYVSKVIHKAFVEVNEEGTEAAAATAASIVVLCIEHIPAFKADRPFIFYISDTSSGSILFLGRLVNPPKSQKRDEL